MQVRRRNTIALAVAVLVLIGAGVALGQTQRSPSPAPTSERAVTKKALRGDAFLDIVARRLGIQRSRLDNALRAQALAEVKWAEDNDFITKTRADKLRERINAGTAKGMGRSGLHGRVGLGLGLHGGSFKGHFRGGFGFLEAAGEYLGLSERDLREALRSKTLAQVARDRGKAVDGLEAALRNGQKARLDDAVAEGMITRAQQDALLERFDAQIGDVVNGIPPSLTDLARHLGIPRARLIAAIKNAAIEQVDAALAKDAITKSRADALKQRIRSSPAWPLGGKGLRGFGLCGGIERPGADFDL